MIGSLCTPTCGDGILAGAEVCDDEALFDNRGCLDDCTGNMADHTCTGTSC